MFYRSNIRFRRFVRKLLNKGDPPERVARGIAAGFFAAAFPLPGFQILLSVFFAWIVRGNKAVAIFPQFLSNAATMVPIAWFQFWIGTKIWPATGPKVQHALSHLQEASDAWDWNNLPHSLEVIGAAFGGLGADVLGPLGIGVGVTGLAAAAISYPVVLVSIAYFNAYQIRRRAAHGIGLRPPRGRFDLPETTEALRDPSAFRAYVTHPEKLVSAERVKLLVDGREAFPEMLAGIRTAKKNISLETYILRADSTGHRFADALIEAANRGVSVRMMYDGMGGLGLPFDYVEKLLKGGVKVSVYRPLSTLFRIGFGPMNRRDHRKILVIDGEIAFTGGLNIASEYAAKQDGGEGWRDTHLRIDGELPAQQFQALFDETWRKSERFEGAADAAIATAATAMPRAIRPPGSAAGPEHTVGGLEEHAHAPDFPTSAGDGASFNVPVQVISNKEFIQRVRLRRAYLHAINNANRYILIENAYFIPDRGIRNALRKAVKRGVKVGVVVAMYSDVKVAAMASRSLYGELLSSGVRLFEYPPTMLHCKIAVVDDAWAIVSSYNLDHRSLVHNLEAGVLLLDSSFARQLREQIVTDISHCREVTLQFHKARPWNEALLESAAYQMRYWL